MSEAQMVRMANQIAAYFASYPREVAVRGIADHLQQFWEPRMREQILAHAAAGGGGLHELVQAALPTVRRQDG